MSSPDDPFASPPREREAGRGDGPGGGRGDGGARVPFGTPAATGWGAPTGPPDPRPAPPSDRAGAGGLGVAALVVGVLALVTGVSIVGGALLGPVAVALGARGRARARSGPAGPGPAGTAVAGIVLGVLGMLAAAGAYLYVRPALEEYQGCRRESVSVAQDKACERELRDTLERR